MTTYIAATRGTPPVANFTTTAIRWLPVVLMALVLLSMFFPEVAFAQEARQKVADAGKKAYDLVFSVVYWLCGIAVVIAGLGATFGRMEWGRFGQIVAGIVVVFSSMMIVEYFQ